VKSSVGLVNPLVHCEKLFSTLKNTKSNSKFTIVKFELFGAEFLMT
jgi:hypothetical protein